MIKLIEIHIKNMVRSKEFYISFIAVFIILLAGSIGEISVLYGAPEISLAPAWYYFGYTGASINKTVIEVFIAFILPFAGSMAYGYFYYDTVKNNGLYPITTRISRNTFLLSGMITALIGGILVVLIPLILCKLVICVAVPIQTIKIMPGFPTSDLMFRNVNFLKDICFNHPYVYYLIYSLIPAVFAGLIGLLSVCLSFFIGRNRFWILTFPGLIYVGGSFIMSILGTTNMVPPFILLPPSGIVGIELNNLVWLFILLIAVNSIMIIIKLLFKKDELSI